MDLKPLEKLGKVAGIGGIALGVVFLLLKDLLANKVFQNLPPDQAYSLLLIITVGLFGLGALGIFAWILAKRQTHLRTAELHAETGSVILGDNAKAHVAVNLSVGSGVLHAGTGEINITGITLEQHEASLRKREQELKADLAQAQQENRALLEKELAAAQEALADLKRSFEQRIAQLKQRIADLGGLRGQMPDALLNEAKTALAANEAEKADALFKQIERHGQDTIMAVAEAAYQRGHIAKEAIDYQTSYRHFQRAVRLQPDEVRYIRAAGRLAAELGDYRKAVQLHDRALASNQKTYGEDDPEVARDRNNLGMAWHDLGDYPKAIGYYEQALASTLKMYGEEHPAVAMCRNNLGAAWHDLGDYPKAIGYYEQALASDLKTYDKDHPIVTVRRNNLGENWRALGDCPKAIGYFEQALASDLKTYGEGHPAVARDRNNLGAAWHDLGDYPKAIEYHEQALASDLKTYGEDHPAVARDRNNLGAARRALGDCPKAIGYYEQALASDLKTYGEGHPAVARDRNNLGAAWHGLGDYPKAIEYFEGALIVMEKTLGANHPDTKAVRDNLKKVKNAI